MDSFGSPFFYLCYNYKGDNMKITSKSPKQLIEIGEVIGNLLDKSAVILLDGPLGAGKTTLTKGIAKGLAIDEIVNSPTFTIAKMYEGRMTLNHLDVYRLEGLNEDIGIEDYLHDNEVLVIEWSKFLNEDVFREYLHINIEYKDDYRELTLTAKGPYYENLLNKVIL